MFWEWQVLVASGISVYACNPRGSQGYGQDFCYANYRDWGDGPMRDVMGGVDALIADGLVDADRLGVTGGSYGGYLTSWIVGHTDRFKAAVTCRSVNDMTSEMLSGDIAGPNFGDYEYGVNPWEDPVLYWQHSPIAYAVQHPHAAADPARREGPPLPDHPGRGAVHGAAVAQARGALHARPRGVARADAQRRAVPAGREHQSHPRLVRALPVEGKKGLPPI